MSIRNIARTIVVALGTIEFILYAAGGFADSSHLFGGGFLFFTGATNFCTQCPLFSVIARRFRRKQREKIPVTRM